MLTVEGIYDGEKVELLSKIPFKEKKKVLITFLNDMPSSADSVSDVDPIKALRGSSTNSNLTSKLLESRREDMEIEHRNRKWRK